MALKLASGKLAFVTGAGSGIGKAVCQVLAREGARIIGSDANGQAVKATVQSLQGEKDHLALTLDVSVKDDVYNAVADSQKYYKQPPSIVVNCAGITRDNFLLKLPEEDFEKVIDVNLKGTFLVIQATAKAMIEANITDGSIVNVGSIVGKRGNMGQANYSSSKAGVEALTRTAAKEFGKFGIRVNAVIPGFISTPMTETVPDKVKKMLLTTVAAGRMGTAEEVSEVIAFLASSRSSYVNGASIDVNGG